MPHPAFIQKSVIAQVADMVLEHPDTNSIISEYLCSAQGSVEAKRLTHSLDFLFEEAYEAFHKEQDAE